ncbi:MAG: dihydropteroate synthase [Lachnospiraceae bacterium]|nr:dihydropteroate synthase [Lachnospiraceae bacterium]
MQIGNRDFDLENHTYVMGILNVTPDSFSDGGRYTRIDKALFRVEEMLDEGMEILDIGGESTRPGHVPVHWEEEARRVMPVIQEIKRRFSIPISLDTCKSQVAKMGIYAGVNMINDVWGLKFDPELASVVSEAKVPCVLMHNRKDTNYQNFMADMISDLKESIEIAHKAGITDDKIILDPGIGFAKTYEHNLEVIGRLDVLKEMGYPVLLGTSRKSVIGQTLDLPTKERVEGTLVTTVFAVAKGCSFVRVHDIKENLRAVKMAEAIITAGRGEWF